MSSCPHTNTVKIIAGQPPRWCRDCGAVHDGKRWLRAKTATVVVRTSKSKGKRASRKAVVMRHPATRTFGAHNLMVANLTRSRNALRKLPPTKLNKERLAAVERELAETRAGRR